MIKLLDTSRQTLHLITQVKDYYIESDLETASKMIHFLMPKSDASYDDLKQELYLQTEDNMFVIKEVNHKQKDYVEVFGKIDVDGLRSTIIQNYESVEKPIALVMADILVDTGWTYQAFDIPTKLRTIRAEDKNAHEIILQAMNVYGLEVDFDALNKEVKVYQSLGADRGSYVQSDLNLKKVEYQSDTYDLVTRIYPYGKDGLTIASINGGKEYVEDFSYTNKIVERVWRDDRYSVQENLKADALAKLAISAKPRISYIADVLQLTKLNPIYSILDYQLGDTVKIMDKDLGIIDYQRVMKLVDYPITPEKNKTHLGNSQLIFKSDEAKLEEQIKQETDKVRTVLMEEIEKTNNLIGGPDKGHILVRKDVKGNTYELLILDTPAVETAAKVWRWNINGLGFSSTGYNGDYRVAITNDGSINADFITTGWLNAEVIKTGLLMSRDSSSWIDMATGAFNFKNQIKWNSATSKVEFGAGVVLQWDSIADTPTIPTTAEEIGARPDTWTPTAFQVGARPRSWTPTAEEVGAKPVDWLPSWNEIVDRPYIPPFPDYIKSTKITATDIESPTITAGVVNGSIFNGGTIIGTVFKTGLSKKRIEINSDGLKTYSDGNALNGVSILPSQNFGQLTFNTASDVHVSSNTYEKGTKVCSAPTSSSQGDLGFASYVYSAKRRASNTQLNNTTYWEPLGWHYYSLPDDLRGTLGAIYKEYSTSANWFEGDALCNTSIVNGRVQARVYKLLKRPGQYETVPRPPHSSWWQDLGNVIAPVPSTREAEIGEIFNDQIPHLITSSTVGIKTYHRDIHLEADGAFRLGGPQNRVPISGDVLLSSRYGKVKAASKEGIDLLTAGNLLISTNFDMESTTPNHVTPGHIILEPFNRPGALGEVHLRGGRTIRSVYDRNSRDLFIRAGETDNGSIYLYSSAVFHSGELYKNSDIKLKENIIDVESSVLKAAEQVPLVNFNMKRSPDKTDVGVLAQEVEKSFDENGVSLKGFSLVNESTDEATGEVTKFVNYEGLLLLKVAALEKRVKELENNKQEV